MFWDNWFNDQGQIDLNSLVTVPDVKAGITNETKNFLIGVIGFVLIGLWFIFGKKKY